MHMKVIVNEVGYFLARCLTGNIILRTVKDAVSIIMCCYILYLLNYAMKSDVKQ